MNEPACTLTYLPYDLQAIQSNLDNKSSNIMAMSGIHHSSPEFTIENMVNILNCRNTKLEPGETWAYISSIIKKYKPTGVSLAVLKQLLTKGYVERVVFCPDSTYLNHCIIGFMDDSDENSPSYKVGVCTNWTIQSKDTPRSSLARLKWVAENFDSIYCCLEPGQERWY